MAKVIVSDKFNERFDLLEAMSYIYLLLPLTIFLLGFLNPIVGLPLSILAILATYAAIGSRKRWAQLQIVLNSKLIIVLLVLLAWVVLSGVGGFVWQNRYDHMFRNAIFMDLVNHEWPVILDKNTLCYYIGFWLPASLVGKLLGIDTGYLFQIVWAYLGVVLAFLLICKKFGDVKFRYLIIFILFSGLDIIVLMGKDIISGGGINLLLQQIAEGTHIELLLYLFNASSNTTLLFWLYNQTIPFWVAFLLFLECDKRHYGIIFLLLLLFSPFPLVGMFPLVIYKMIYDIGQTNLQSWIRDCLSFSNISSVIIAIPIVLYYKSNVAGSKLGLLPFDINTILIFLVYSMIEYGFYLFFVIKFKRLDSTLVVLGFSTLVFSFVTIGNSYDFAWRTCIPFSFYIMLKVIEISDSLFAENGKVAIKTLLIVTLALGAVTPCTEMIRSFNGEISVLKGEDSARCDRLASVFDKENNDCYENFIGSDDSAFNRYLAKK